MIVLERLLSVAIFMLFSWFLVSQIALPLFSSSPLFPSLRGADFRRRAREAKRRLEDVDEAHRALELEVKARAALNELPEEEREAIIREVTHHKR